MLLVAHMWLGTLQARRLASAMVPCGGADVNFPSVDHGLSCGDCKVLVDNFQSYGSCEAYCLSIGRTCVSAAEEQSDDCNVKFTMGCGDNAGGSTSDALCECSAGLITVSCGGNQVAFPDIDHGTTCGNCKVLVNNFQDYGSCDRYCLTMGRTCVSAAEESGDTCAVRYDMNCGDNAGGGTSDVRRSQPLAACHA